MSSYVNKIFFEEVKRKLQTAHESYDKYISAMKDFDQSLEDFNRLLKDMCDYAVKNKWGIMEMPEQEISNYLIKGKPRIDDVMEKIVKAFGVPEGEI